MRDYDPTMGRYLQADPLGLEAGVSLHGYALLSPMRYIDPTGENPLAACATPLGSRICGAIARETAKICVEGVKIVAGAAIGLFASTGEACGCEDDRENEQPLRNLKKLSKGQLRTMISTVGHPHEFKDGSFEDIYISRNGCLYVGNKNGAGVGRLIGKM